MKTLPILLTLILMISCAQTLPPKNTDSSIPVVEISPISNQTAESNPSLPDEIVAVLPVKVPAFPTPDEVSTEDFWRKDKSSYLRKFGLYDLEQQQIIKNDLEVRVWQIFDLYMRKYKDSGVKESVFILKRSNGDWSAEVFRNTVKPKSDIVKQIKTKLDVPKSGWENIWQDFVNNELLTFPDSVSGEVIFGLHAGRCIIESKVDGIFKKYEHAGNQEVREIRHISKILNIIAGEFNLEDYRATKRFE